MSITTSTASLPSDQTKTFEYEGHRFPVANDQLQRSFSQKRLPQSLGGISDDTLNSAQKAYNQEKLPFYMKTFNVVKEFFSNILDAITGIFTSCFGKDKADETDKKEKDHEIIQM